eukprot:6851838-Ditylum_brightwellii.AAC.1
MKQQPYPHTLWIKDITPMIKKWIIEGEVMLLVDANSGLGDKDFALFIAEVGLCDTIEGRHGIDSHNTNTDGSKTIDFIFCSPGMIETVKRSGMLRFYDGIHSDHQGLYCDVNVLHLIRGKIHNIQAKPTRRYHIKHKKRGRQYRADVSNIIQQTNLCQQAKKLANAANHNTEMMKNKLEEVDNKLTEAMLLPEQQIPIPHHAWSSNTIKVAHLIVQFWKTRVSMLKYPQQDESILQDIASTLGP